MKLAKSSKIIFLIAALVLSLACAFCFMRFDYDVAKADDALNLDDYFSCTSAEINIADEKLVVTTKSGENKGFKITNELLVDDFATEFTASNGVKEITLTVTADSYYGVGVKKDGESETVTEIENVIVIDLENKKIKINDGTEKTFSDATEYTLKLSVENNLLSAKINEDNEVTASGDYYKIGGDDKTAANLKFDFKKADEDATVSFKYIDQGASAIGNPYKQEFKTANPEKATSRARVSFGGAYSDNNENILYFVNGKVYKAVFTEYSLLGKNGNSLKLDKIDGSTAKVWLSNETNSDDIKVTNGGTFAVKAGESTLETYSVSVYEKTADTTLPVYTESDVAINAYKDALKKTTEKDYDGKTLHVKLGDKITVPSMKGLVSDDKTAYENLTHTMYYRTPSSSTGSTDGWTITLSEAGKYQFYVVFKDEAGNAIDKDDFYKLDDNGNKIAFGDLESDEKTNHGNSGLTDYKYSAFVFDFVIEDDAPITVVAADSQGKGYLDTEYTFSSFTVEASSYTPTYQLFYSATENGEYKEITAKSKIDDEDDYDNEDFTYAEMTGFAYDGKLTFTPVKAGYYKVICTVSSQKVRSESAEAFSGLINEKPSVVKPDTHWLENNVWSVVFLGIGTLCLIGIVVLLFIKPKEEIDDGDVK